MTPHEPTPSLLLQTPNADDEYYPKDHGQNDPRNEEEAPLFSAGMIADIQYAPVPDGFSYNGKPRYYQNSLHVARKAAEHFHHEDVPICIQLGDIVDGKCQDLVGNGGTAMEDGVDVGEACIQHVTAALSNFERGTGESCKSRTIIHTYGNHCMYNVGRESLQKLLNIPFAHERESDERVGYFSHSHQNIRFVVIDSYDICLMRRSPSQTKWEKADKIMRENNPNYPQQENSPQGLKGLQKRFVGFNGGVDEPQLAWLKNTLKEAKEAGQKAVILSHQPILPGSTNPVCLMWNYDEVLDILREFRTTVIASFSGHAHKGGYKRDKTSGIHFRVVEAVLENMEKTYGFLDVYDNRIVLRGQGRCQSATYDFAHMGEAWSSSQLAPAADAVSVFRE